MGVVSLIRIATLGTTTLFSIIVLGIAANLISQTQHYFHATATFCAFAVAVAVISLLSLPAMIVVDFITRGAFTSMIVVELTWLSILCILWLASAADTVTGSNLLFPFGCDHADTIFNGMCQKTQAIEAFSFLNFIITLLYVGMLSMLSAIAASRGEGGVWLSSVKESFISSAAPAEHHPMAQHGTAAAAHQGAVQAQHTTMV